MKAWALYLLVMTACHCLGQKSILGSSRSRLESRFIADYVAFYGIKQVCLLGVESVQSGVQAMSQIASAVPFAYTSMLGNEMDGRKQGQSEANATSGIYSAICSCPGLRVFRLETADNLRFFQQVFTGTLTKRNWLLISSAQFMELLEAVYLPLNNKVTIANFSRDGKRATLFEMYQVGQQYQQRVVPVGHWVYTPLQSPEPGPVFKLQTRNPVSNTDSSFKEEVMVGHEDSTFAEVLVGKGIESQVKRLGFGVLQAPVDDPYLRRQDLSGVHLTCTTMELPPMTMLEKKADGSVTVHGLTGRFFDTLKELMNFTYTCYAVKDGQFGAFVDGKWTGMMKEVMEGEANISVGNLAITHQRYEVVDFLIGTISAGFRIVMKRPSNEDYIWTVYTKQFEAEVWGVAVFVMTASATLLYLIVRRSLGEEDVTLSEVVLTVVGFMFGQGTTITFRTSSSRVLVLTLLILQVVLLAYYTSNLTSALTVGPPLPPYNTLADVHNDRSLTLGFLRGSSIGSQFLASEIPVYRAVGRSVKDADLVPSYGAGMERVYREKYALIIWDISYTMNFGHDCRSFMLPESYLPIDTSFVLAKDSPLTPIMNKVVLDIKSSGIMTKWWKDLSVKKKDCNVLETAPIILKTVLTPFLMLGLAMAVSLSILFIERRAYLCKK